MVRFTPLLLLISTVTTAHTRQLNSIKPIRNVVEISSAESILKIRGGAAKKKKKSSKKATTATGKKSVVKEEKKENLLLEKYSKILPATRVYITLVGLMTLAGLVLGEEGTFEMLALNPLKIIHNFEFHRLLTAGAYLGAPSVGWLMSAYYLFEYGSSLERAYGTAQFVVFVLSQIVLLSGSSILLGQPFFANSVITSMLHVLSRSMPNQKVKWLIFTVPYWALPYGLMASDVLQSQSASSALPHILGILTGHFYHFHKFIWPKLEKGQDWLNAPQFMVSLLEPKSEEDAAKEKLNATLKGRSKKGRKLGS